MERIGRWESERQEVREICPSLRQEKSGISQPLLRKKTNQPHPDGVEDKSGVED